MRRSLTLSLALVLALSMPARALATAVAVDTSELVVADATLDGTTVRFGGEAIGEALRAQSGYRWVAVLADGNAVGVVVPERLVAGVDGYGDWDTTGSSVEVVGVYNVACEQHGGDLDVHATEFRVTESSRTREHPIHPEKAVAAALILAAAAGLAVRFRSMRRRMFD